MNLSALLENNELRALLDLQTALINNKYNIDVETEIKNGMVLVDVPGISDAVFDFVGGRYRWHRKYQNTTGTAILGSSTNDVIDELPWICCNKLQLHVRHHKLQLSIVTKTDLERLVKHLRSSEHENACACLKIRQADKDLSWYLFFMPEGYFSFDSWYDRGNKLSFDEAVKAVKQATRT